MTLKGRRKTDEFSLFLQGGGEGVREGGRIEENVPSLPARFSPFFVSSCGGEVSPRFGGRQCLSLGSFPRVDIPLLESSFPLVFVVVFWGWI